MMMPAGAEIPDVVAPSDERVRPGPWLTAWLYPFALLVAAFLAYQNSFSGKFLFDDVAGVQNNFEIRRLWPIWNTMWGPPGSGVAGRPVVQLSYAINYAIHGLDVRGYHAGNLILHAMTSLVLFGVIRRTLALPAMSPKFGQHATNLAFAITLIWLTHPLLTDSITYISGRTEILAGMFLSLTLYCFIRGIIEARHSRCWNVLACVCCIIGIGCKEILVVAPLLVWLYDRMFVAGSFVGALRQRRLLYAGLFTSLLFIPLNLSMADFHRHALVAQERLSSWDYLKVQSEVIVMYVRLSVWPHPLVIDYQGWNTHPTLLKVLPFGMAVLAALGLTIYGVVRQHPAGFAGAWFFLILAPTSSILPLPTEIATERRMYLPLIAMVALVVLSGWRILLRAASSREGRQYLAGAVLVIVAGEIHATRTRNAAYQDVKALWADVVARRPNNARGLTNLGYEYLAEKDYAAAKQCFLRAVQLDVENYASWNNLGNIFLRERNDDEAVRCFQAALKAKPDYAASHSNLGILYFARDELVEAEQSFREAVRLQPARADHMTKLARVLAKQGKLDESERMCRAALAIDLDLAVARDQLGLVLAAKGKSGEAISAFREAVRLAPQEMEFQTHLAWHLAAGESSLRNPAEAITLATRAVEASSGNNPLALDANALAYAANGDFDNAVAAARRAIELAKVRRPSRVPAIEHRLAAYEMRAMPSAEFLLFDP
jgi:tetratricopeptide (TPR) repeat protein